VLEKRNISSNCQEYERRIFQAGRSLEDPTTLLTPVASGVNGIWRLRMLTPITDTRPKVMWTDVIRTYYMCSVGRPFELGGLKYRGQETK